MTLPHTELKTYHRAHRDNFPDGLNLRVHRALSWLHRAEQCGEEIDGQFIFLWIAFNAAYAQETHRRELISESETRKMRAFFSKVCDLDADRRIYGLLWERFSQELRLLLDSPFVFQMFWDAQLRPEVEVPWEERLAKRKRYVHRALAAGKAPEVLGVVFNRLYVLRNQLIHGNATWNSAVNREQVQLGAAVLRELVPVVLDVMMRNPGALWGDAAYPVIK